MTEKPIKATLANSSDECKTQKPILIQLEDIPTPEVGDAGKVLGVDEEGKYALTEGGGGGVNPANAPYINLSLAELNTLMTNGVIQKQLSGYTVGTYSELIVINVENGSSFIYLRPVSGYFDDDTLIISHYAGGMYSTDANKYLVYTYIADDEELYFKQITTL